MYRFEARKGRSWIASVLLLAACGRQDVPQKGESLTESINQSLSSDSLIKGEERVASCMRRLGFTYQVNVSSTAVLRTGFLELVDLERLAKYGYRDSAASGVDPNLDPYLRMSESDQGAWDAALYGPAYVSDKSVDGGCLQLRYPTVTVPNRDQLALLPTSPLWQQLVRKWAACMAENGYPNVKSEMDVATFVTSELDGPDRRPTPNLLIFARIDASCRRPVLAEMMELADGLADGTRQ